MSSLGIAAADDAALETVFAPFAGGELSLSASHRVLFLRARDGFRLREMARPGWQCQQSFKPFATALQRSGFNVAEPVDGERFDRVLLLPPRQRDEARALFARAMQLVSATGVVVACVANAEGARTAEGDLGRLAGPVHSLSKHKCRVFWTRPGEVVDGRLAEQWAALDAPRLNPAGYQSRPGLFAWDRIDRASQLLAQHLPTDLAGRVADLGAGYGYLACQLLARCPQLRAIDLYEAEARALVPARMNMQQALLQRGEVLPWHGYWHDVTEGLPARYDAIVSNPPFHQGRADLPQLGRAFIARAADALDAPGRLWLVANRHLPYETMLHERFAQVREVVAQDGFKVIEAYGVRG